MIANGGYLILDFKGLNLSTKSIKIQGIRDKITRANKPIIVTNIGKIEPYSLKNQYVVSRDSSGELITLTFITASSLTNLYLYIIFIDLNDNVTAIAGPYQSGTAENLESEVRTNAGKSDSSIG